MDFRLHGDSAFLNGVFDCGADVAFTWEQYLEQLDGYADCDSDGTSDHQEVGSCASADCNGDGVPDDCQIANGTADDVDPPNGVPDECDCTVAPPSGSVFLEVRETYLTWDAEESPGWDAVRGDLGILRTTSGSFESSIDRCLANDFPLIGFPSAEEPPPESTWYFLVRALNCAGPGSWDSDGGSQTQSRDVGVDGSPMTCKPFVCGNGRREPPNEVCDRFDLGCTTCQDQGFAAGSLKCNSVCTGYDTSQCVNP
jgi:hypothetical protein